MNGMFWLESFLIKCRSLLCQFPVVLDDQVDHGRLSEGAGVPQVPGVPGCHLPQDPPHDFP